MNVYTFTGFVALTAGAGMILGVISIPPDYDPYICGVLLVIIGKLDFIAGNQQ